MRTLWRLNFYQYWTILRRILLIKEANIIEMGLVFNAIPKGFMNMSKNVHSWCNFLHFFKQNLAADVLAIIYFIQNAMRRGMGDQNIQFLRKGVPNLPFFQFWSSECHRVVVPNMRSPEDCQALYSHAFVH